MIHFKCNVCTGNYDGNKRHKELHEWLKILSTVIKLRDICGGCLKEDSSLHHLDEIFVINNNDVILKDILKSSLGVDVITILVNEWICDVCVDIALKAFTLKLHIENGSNAINKLSDIFNMKISEAKSCDGIKINFKCDDILHVTANDSDKHNIVSDYVLHVNIDTDLENDELPLSKVKEKLQEKYECSRCQKRFNSFMLWKRHSEKHSKGAYVCKHCRKEFTKLSVLVKHRNIIHNDGIIHCNICKVIVLKNKKRKHYHYYHKDLQLICDMCGKKVYDKTSLKKHLTLKHADALNFKCSYCLKCFNSNFNILKHRCANKCNDCTVYPCMHQKYINSLNEQHNSGAKPFKCVDCGFVVTYKHQLIGHVNKVHLNHCPHLCDFCGESFVSKELLKYHHKHKHKEPIRCKYCNKGFKDQTMLDVHLPICEITERPYKCDLCTHHFTSQEKAMFHRRKHFSKEFNCEICSKKYWTNSELNIHKKRVHSDKLDLVKAKIYQCSMCPLDFISKRVMLEHSSTHSNNSAHVCRECSASFKSKINYYGHIRKHKIKKNKECHICFKLYDKYNIGNHIKSHNIKDRETKLEKAPCRNSQNTMCEICGRFLLNERSLIKHRETHKEQKQCHHCLKFVNTILFDKHMKTHHIEMLNAKTKRQRKEFKCSKCEYTTFFIECLEAHINRHHLQCRPFQCDICKKGFYAKLTLKEHIKIHSGLKPEQCHQCGNRFVNKKALKMHVRIHTGEKPYGCDLCEEKFLSASRRQAHRIRKHFEPSVQCPICLKMYYTQSVLRIHIKDCHSSEPRQRNRKKISDIT